MSSDFFGKLIHDNFIFDIPRLIEICSLYGEDNEKIVQKMIDSIFWCQPEYYEDLKEVCEAAINVINNFIIYA